MRCQKYLVRITNILLLLLIVLVGVVLLPGTSQNGASYAQGTDNPTYLMGNDHTGFNGNETIINSTNAPNLKLLWTRQAGVAVSSQVVEAGGLLYWGSWDGYEHASNPSDGTDVWRTYLGKVTNAFCPPANTGVASTATIASMTIEGVPTEVDYVGGGDANFFALNASTGAVIWKYSFGASPNHMIWDSPVVWGSSVYIGISSYGDCPLVGGHLVKLDGATGAVQADFTVVPKDCNGGGIWASPTLDEGSGMIYIATANGLATSNCTSYGPYAGALVELRASDLSPVGSWQIPLSERLKDGDFGSTPTLFHATINSVVHQMVGVENKNGNYYAFDRSQINAGPLWEDHLAVPPPDNPLNHQPSIATSSWDGNSIYEGGAYTTINGTNCAGSLRALNPATGAFRWQICLTGNVFTPVISVPGLVVVGAGQYMKVFDSSSGQLLFRYRVSSINSNLWDWGPANIIQGVLYQGNRLGTLYAFGL